MRSMLAHFGLSHFQLEVGEKPLSPRLESAYALHFQLGAHPS